MSSLKLEEGKFYRSRDGRKIGPMRCWCDGVAHPWEDPNFVDIWSDNGIAWCGQCAANDLVAEWVDEWVDGAEDEVLYASPSRGCCNTASAKPTPERVKILHDGASLTNGDRDDEYGPPANNMTCAGELKAVFRKWLARDISPGELEALDMAMTKLSRLSCGKPKRDTYVDAATYIAIAGEIALAPST